jgi:hypothetical protein
MPKTPKPLYYEAILKIKVYKKYLRLNENFNI